MKVKAIVIFLLLFVNFGVFLFFSPSCSAEEANIIFKDITVQLTQTRPPIGATTIREYRITAVLQNVGDKDSVNITVKLKDPQPGLNATLIFLPESYSLAPNEEKTFVFEDWPTSLSGNVLLNISFKPASPNVLETEYNSRSYYYSLQIGSDAPKTSTPGFEVLFVLVAIVALLFTKEVRNNRY
jgi:hypothetical protein